MRSTEHTRPLTVPLIVLGLLVAVAAGVGAPVRATYGARVSADEPQYLLTALSLAEDANLDIADELDEERWRTFHEAQLPVQTRPLAGGRHISPHDPLLPILLAPAMGLGGWLAAKLTLALLAGLLAALTAWVAVRRFGVSLRTAWLVTAVFGASAPLAVYGTQIYPELPAAIAMTAAVAAASGPLRRRGCVVLALAVMALPWLAIKYVPVAAVLAVIAMVRLWRAERRHAVVVLSVAFLAAGAMFGLVHLAVYGGLTSYASGDHFVDGELTAVGSSPNYLGRSVRLVGLLVDGQFGLAAWQPAWLLLVPAATWVLRRRPPHWQLVVLPLAAGWLTATFLALTMQGWWFPGRQVVVVLPAAVLAIALAIDHRRWALALMTVLGLLGLWSYGWLVAAGLRGDIRWIVDFFEVADPWYRQWAEALPAYLDPSARTWVLHAVWAAAAAVATVLAWRSAAAATYEVASVASSTPDAEPEAEPDPDPEADPSSSIVRTPPPSSPPQAVAPRSSASSAPLRRRDSVRDDTGDSFS
jgi:hypothetical protein